MAIRFSAQNISFEPPEAANVRQWVTQVIKQRGKQVGNLSYLFCNDEFILEMNRRFLNHDTYTDIITFDNVVGDTIAGDILISIDRVGENASLFNVPFEQELHRVIIHGVLHLLGQGDKSDSEAAEMRRQEGDALQLWEAMFHKEQKC